MQLSSFPVPSESNLAALCIPGLALGATPAMPTAVAGEVAATFDQLLAGPVASAAAATEPAETTTLAMPAVTGGCTNPIFEGEVAAPAASKSSAPSFPRATASALASPIAIQSATFASALPAPVTLGPSAHAPATPTPGNGPETVRSPVVPPSSTPVQNLSVEFDPAPEKAADAASVEPDATEPPIFNRFTSPFRAKTRPIELPLAEAQVANTPIMPTAMLPDPQAAASPSEAAIPRTETAVAPRASERTTEFVGAETTAEPAIAPAPIIRAGVAPPKAVVNRPGEEQTDAQGVRSAAPAVVGEAKPNDRGIPEKKGNPVSSPATARRSVECVETKTTSANCLAPAAWVSPAPVTDEGTVVSETPMLEAHSPSAISREDSDLQTTFSSERHLSAARTYRMASMPSSSVPSSPTPVLAETLESAVKNFAPSRVVSDATVAVEPAVQAVSPLQTEVTFTESVNLDATRKPLSQAPVGRMSFEPANVRFTPSDSAVRPSVIVENVESPEIPATPDAPFAPGTQIAPQREAALRESMAPTLLREIAAAATPAAPKTESSRSVPEAKFAENGAVPKDTAPGVKIAPEKSFLDMAHERVTTRQPALGIGSAKPGPTMSAGSATLRSAYPMTEHVAATTAVVSAPMEATPQPLPFAAEVASTAHRAVEAVLNVAERFSARDHHAVNLQFTVGGADLTVRVELRSEGAQATFRTDSPELRAALSHEWQAVAATTPERSFRAIQPVFTSTDGGAANGFTGENASRQRDANARRSPETSAIGGTRSRGHARSGAAASAPLASAAFSGSSHHLHTLA